MELFAHTAGGVATYLWYRDKGKKTIYHTGLATSLMMFLPAAAYLIAHIAGVTATDWLWCLVLFAVMCCVCVPLTETPLKKWVRKQEPGMFAFEDAKYYMRYGGYCQKEDYPSALTNATHFSVIHKVYTFLTRSKANS